MRINHPCKTRAFTLIELILVMAVLIMLVSLVVPKLKDFFGNRDMDSEVRRFVALTRYGQNRAVSEGIPALLWVDPKAGEYGLELESGYTDSDTKAEEFSLPAGLTIGVDMTTQVGSKAFASGKAIGIRFSPDGSVIADKSVKGVFIKQANGAQVWIVQSPDRLSYEVKS